MSSTEPIYEKNSNGKFLLIRHGETNYNCTQHLLNKTKRSEDEIALKWDARFIDCKLNEIGVSQSESLQEALSILSITKVYSSPLTRCIETAIHSLKVHKNREHIVIIVVPLLSEVVHSIHDGCSELQAKMNYLDPLASSYGLKIDWSELEEKKETYYFAFIDNLEKERAESLQFHEILKTCISEYGVKPESMKSSYSRSLQIKQRLQKEFSLKENSDEKVLLYSHSGFIRILTCSKNLDREQLCQKGLIYPKDSYMPSNCEIISLYLDQ